MDLPATMMIGLIQLLGREFARILLDLAVGQWKMMDFGDSGPMVLDPRDLGDMSTGRLVQLEIGPRENRSTGALGGV